MIRTIIASICLVLLPVSFVGAGTINIVVGDYNFAPNTGVHTVDIYASSSGGDTNVQGLNFVMDAPGTGANVFSGVDIVSNSNMLFASNNSGQNDLAGLPGPLIYTTTTTSSSTVTIGSERKLLGTVTIDTTGVTPGTYDLRMTGTEAGNTDFGAISANITNGTITFGGEEVPEPASLLLMAGLMACGVPAVIAYRRRQHTATAC